MLDQVLTAATLTRPTAPADGHDRRPRRPAGRAHRAARPRARRAAGPGPPAPGGDVVTATGPRRADVVARVVDPELPMLTLADLGVLARRSRTTATATVVVRSPRRTRAARRWASCAPTCVPRCTEAGYGRGRRAHRAVPRPGAPTGSPRPAAASSPRPASPRRAGPARGPGPGAAQLTPPSDGRRCPLCGSADTEELSEFGATAVQGAAPLPSCREPFEHLKEI